MKYRDHLGSITIATNLFLKSWTKDGVISWAKDDMRVLMMTFESNVTDAADVISQSSSNRCR